MGSVIARVTIVASATGANSYVFARGVWLLAHFSGSKNRLQLDHQPPICAASVYDDLGVSNAASHADKAAIPQDIGKL